MGFTEQTSSMNQPLNWQDVSDRQQKCFQEWCDWKEHEIILQRNINQRNIVRNVAQQLKKLNIQQFVDYQVSYLPNSRISVRFKRHVDFATVKLSGLFTVSEDS